MNAPTPVIILLPFDAGSPKVVRQVKPPPYPKARRDPLPPYLPTAQIADIQRRSQELLEAVRAQRRS